MGGTLIAIETTGARSWEVLERDWFGKKIALPPSYLLVLKPGFLEFSVRGKNAPDVGKEQPGSFAQGLWKHDVGELFLGAARGENYLEIHIAPNGCWWIGEFARERELVSDWEDGSDPEGFVSEVETTPEGDSRWRATLRIPRSYLEKNLGGDVSAWRGNVTAMVMGGGERRYLTANAPPAGLSRPDFHHAALRQQIDFR